MKTYALALDLKDDPELIREYESYHKRIWPEITASIKESGIEHMQIYRTANRLFMLMQVGEDFSFDKKAQADNNNPKVQEWENLMWKYQQALPGAAPGEKWRLMEEIFSLEA
ncbi:L-rhamnose mutarotase [Arachidicoccus rhizosphaerae]|nr:L-rhamnose mutarotase [Arachidicoccus rhizosphaerae]